MKWSFIKILYIFICSCIAIVCCYPAFDPLSGVSPETRRALKEMRQVPQWHCMRYRKLDSVRRCRHFRVGPVRRF